MKEKRHSEESIEQALAAAYRGQPAPEPSEQWHQRVMQAVRVQGGVLSVMPIRLVESRIVWRAACVAAAAAVIMAILGFWVMPSDARLAWQFQREGVASAWLLQVGE
jgi:hypothetical protein